MAPGGGKTLLSRPSVVAAATRDGSNGNRFVILSNEQKKSFRGAVCIGDADESLLREHELDQVIEYWNRVRGDRFAPTWRDIDLLALPDFARQGMMVVDVLAEEVDFRIRYWGIGLVDGFGIDLTGRRVTESEHGGVMNSFMTLAENLEAIRNPQRLIHRIVLPSGIPRLFPVVRLPLSDDGDRITGIISVENFQKCLKMARQPSEP